MQTRQRARAATAAADGGLDAACDRLRAGAPPPAALVPCSQRHAAVLALLFEVDGVPHVWMTQRAHSLRHHAGEVCLPGGKQDEGDADAVSCALREAHEEVGLLPSDVEVLCSLPPVLSAGGLSVTPVVGRLRAPSFTPRPNPGEVAAVLHAPLSAFLTSDRHTFSDVEWASPGGGSVVYRLHYFAHTQRREPPRPPEEYTVWGLTAAVLIDISQLALGRPPCFEVDAPGGAPFSRLHHDGVGVRLRE